MTNKKTYASSISRYPKINEEFYITGFCEKLNDQKCVVISRNGDYLNVEVLTGMYKGNIVEVYPCELYLI